MTEKTKSRNLYQRLLEAAKEVGLVVKKQPQGVRYKVMSHDDVTDATRDAMMAHGINVFTSIVEYIPSTDTTTRTYTDKDGVDVVEVKSSSKYAEVVDTTLINSDDPNDRITVRTIGRGRDDQGGGGISYGAKYVLKQALFLRTGTDADFHEEQRERQDVEKYERDVLYNRISDRRQELELSKEQACKLLKEKGHDPNPAKLSLLILKHFTEWFEAAGSDEVNGLLGQTESGPDTKEAMRLYNELEMKPQDMIATFERADIDFNANNDVTTNLTMLSDTQYDRVVVLLREASGLEPAEVSG